MCAWWCTPVIQGLRRERQAHLCEFKACLFYMGSSRMSGARGRSCLKKAEKEEKKLCVFLSCIVLKGTHTHNTHTHGQIHIRIHEHTYTRVHTHTHSNLSTILFMLFPLCVSYSWRPKSRFKHQCTGICHWPRASEAEQCACCLPTRVAGP